MFENLLNKTGSSGGGPGGGLPVGNKPTKGNGSGITLNIPTKVDPLAGQKASEIQKNPGMTFGPNKVNVAKNTISSHGAKPGGQVTTNVPSKQKTTNIGTKKYSGKKSWVDVLGESGNFSNQSFDQMMVGAGGKPHFQDTPENREKWKQYYKPKTVTTGTPGAEADVSVPIELDNPAEETTNGETTVETKTIPDDKTTKDTKRGKLPFGSANLTKGGTGRKGSNPIKPVSLATSGSQSKDFNLKLNNQAVNKA